MFEYFVHSVSTLEKKIIINQDFKTAVAAQTQMMLINVFEVHAF